jgi:hypothetical protein
LKLEDLWALDRKNITRFILTKFNKVWIPTVEKEKKNAIIKASEGEPVITNISILSSLLKTFWSGFLFVALLKFLRFTRVYISSFRIIT